MEPGLTDRDHAEDEWPALAARVAAMEPGLTDRDHRRGGSWCTVSIG